MLSASGWEVDEASYWLFIQYFHHFKSRRARDDKDHAQACAADHAGLRTNIEKGEKKVTSLTPGTGYTVRAAWFPT